MTSNIAACVAALAGAFFLALAAALQQRGAAAAPGRGTVNPALLFDLVRTPVWLAGTVAGLMGVTLQVLALRWGPLALVQPVGVTTLLFALPVGAATWGRQVTRVEMYAAAAVALGLGGLLVTLRPASSVPSLDQGRLVTLGLIVATGLVICVIAAFRVRGQGRTILLAAGAGAAFGTTAALVEVLVHRAVDHGPSVFANWLTLAAFAASASGFLLCQAAYRSGRLSTALATILVVDPLTAIGVGVFALREPVSTSFPLAIGAETLLIVAGIVVLARPSARGSAEAPGVVFRGRRRSEVHGGADRLGDRGSGRRLKLTCPSLYPVPVPATPHPLPLLLHDHGQGGAANGHEGGSVRGTGFGISQRGKDGSDARDGTGPSGTGRASSKLCRRWPPA